MTSIFFAVKKWKMSEIIMFFLFIADDICRPWKRVYYFGSMKLKKVTSAIDAGSMATDSTLRFPLPVLRTGLRHHF